MSSTAMPAGSEDITGSKPTTSAPDAAISPPAASLKVTVTCVDCKRQVEGIMTEHGSGGFYVLGTVGPKATKIYLCDRCAGWSFA